jgi:molecular chaperone DnaK
VETTLALVRNTLKDAGLRSDQIDRVLLTGGSTRVPAVQTTLARFFGTSPDTSVNPDEAVALGAAIMAARTMIEAPPPPTASPAESSVPPASPAAAEVVDGLHVTDVTAHSFGIEACVPGTEQRVHSIIIRRNTPLPAEESREFATVLPNQTAIQVLIYQGEFQELAKCNPIGEFILSGLPPNRPAGRKVRVTFSCDTSGVIHVTALDIETGTATATSVGYQVGQSSEQVSARKCWMDTQTVE